MKLFLQKVLEEIRMMYTVHLRIVGVLFFIPVIYTLIFGGLFYKKTLNDVPIIVCNLDDGFRSQGLIRDLYDTPEIAIKFVQMSPMDFEQTIIHEKVSAIVVIPKDYRSRRKTPPFSYGDIRRTLTFKTNKCKIKI